MSTRIFAFGLIALAALLAILALRGPDAGLPAAPASASHSTTDTDGDVLALRPVAAGPLATIGLRDSGTRHLEEGATSPAAAPACDKDIDVAGSIAGVAFVASQDNGICTTGEIDAYENGGNLYLAQAGGQEAAFTITRIAPNGTPTLVMQTTWAQPNTYTADIKAFKQGAGRYVALALERMTLGAGCGVVIVDVTDAPTTAIVAQVTGLNWCDVHNVFVEKDGSGDGRYLYLTADLPNDMRVLDIGDLGNISEIGRYTHPEASDSNYVHDMTVIDHGGSTGRRVYVSYWNAGVMILDAADVTPGVIEPGSMNQPLNPNHSIDPAGFRTHDAYPSADGSRVFIEDEFLTAAGSEPVQMWDISSPASPSYVDGIPLGSALMPVLSPAHNLLVVGDRLYVGWYKGGLQAFDFDSAGFTGRPLYHQVQTEPGDDAYDGAWNVLLATVGTSTYVFQSDRRYGLIVDELLPAPDSDGDGVPDRDDLCPGTAAGPVDANGCSDAQVDGDGDGVCNPGAASGGPSGCSGSDNCPSTVNPGQSDGDTDAVGDACDNCPDDPNPNQENVDGDEWGDACDADDDGDGVNDDVETPCGSDPLNDNSIPERVDGVFDNVDDDGNDGADEPLPLEAAGFDCDGDGYVGTTESHVFTPATGRDQDPCGSDAWAAELVAGSFSSNKVNIEDLASFVAPVRRLNSSSGDAGFDQRWDLAPGSSFGETINVQDMGSLIVVRPSMFGGMRAYNGPECPWPP